jgi:hypothetical protein
MVWSLIVARFGLALLSEIWRPPSVVFCIAHAFKIYLKKYLVWQYVDFLSATSSVLESSTNNLDYGSVFCWTVPCVLEQRE